MQQDNEEVLLKLKRSRRSFLLEYGSGLFLIGLVSLFNLKRGYLNIPLTSLVGGLSAFSIFSAEYARLSHKCEVTKSKLVITDGVLKQKKRHIYIGAVSDIDVRQGVMQRLLNYGIINIKAMSGEDLVIRDVVDPKHKMIEVEKIMEKYRGK